ncbi:NAD(P)/FAD-dependent oxidoreductase [Candidatus Poribacteria bacterium]|nr:NAD(P)/FAD-dependent oxidoreductase [Candidatus Poribacteria bacterium]MYG05699.1 NAD(P)/FAD-dependent oxidoreductase [Candidatus Poribacteria bacterium]MYK22751.1 NAD(P)/FAD-dependent oxidoreductase [Candidatus Poribacteria bacterium]
MNTHHTYDTIVIGGGPAGSTVATLVAEHGHRVLLLERATTPQFKIGESLIPATYWTFKRLGMLEKLRTSHFPQKYSVQFYSRTGRGSTPFYFFQTNPHESAVTWQVLRSEFDQMLLDNAKEKGVEVRRGIGVREVLFEGDTATGVVTQNTDGTRETLHATVIVDSTGQRSLIGKQLKLNTIEPNLKMASLFTHYEGGHRDEGIDEGATLILHTEEKDSWFWSIPLPYNRTSIGVVGELDYLLQNRRDANGKLNAQKIFTEELNKCIPLKQRLEDAKQLLPIQTTKDFSYRASRIAGNHWVLVGDAFGFLDPVYSTGLFLALKSGEMAADAIIEAFRKNDFSEAQLGSFGPAFVDGMEAFRKLVYAFYTKEFSFARFLSEHPEHQGGIVDILSGDVFRKDVTHIFPAMAEMCPLPPEISLD